MQKTVAEHLMEELMEKELIVELERNKADSAAYVAVFEARRAMDSSLVAQKLRRILKEKTK